MLVDAPRAGTSVGRLGDVRYLKLTTFELDGTPVARPVWVVSDDGRRLLVSTGAETGTAERMRRNPRVLVAPAGATGKLRGEQIEARARLLDGAEGPRVTELIREKYGLWVPIAQAVSWVGRVIKRQPRSEPALIEIVDAPDVAVAGPPDARGTQRRRKSPLRFFVLVFALAIPFWLLRAVTGWQVSADLPVSSFIWVCPVIAAAILTYRDNGTAGVTELLRRSFDHKRITAKAWYAPILLLLPGVYAVTYVVMRVLGLPLPTVQFPIVPALGMFLAYFIAGQFEELGWSGYALDPLLDRWNALQAAVLLGVIWALFHLVPLGQHGRSAGWIAWWSLGTVALRVLFTWIYNNTGKSVFAAVLFHAMGNLSNIGPFLDFGPGGYPYEAQRISALITVVVAAVVTIVWGPRTLARHRDPTAAHALR